MAHEMFQVGDLSAVIGDNEGYEGHRAGYNGVHRLTHRTNSNALFTVTGLNLEHIFDGDRELRRDVQVLFEPRNAPMTLTRISPSEAELHQPPTPNFHLESWTRFKLVAPHYIDFTFRCRPHQHAFSHGYIGLFWASYIDAPENKAIYFRDDQGWVQFCTQTHTDESTVVHVEDKAQLKFTPNTRTMLYKTLSPLRFSDPVYYGLFGSHQYILMFDRTQESASHIPRVAVVPRRQLRRPGTGNSSSRPMKCFRITNTAHESSTASDVPATKSWPNIGNGARHGQMTDGKTAAANQRS